MAGGKSSGLEKCLVLTMSHIDDPESRQFIESHGIVVLMKPFEVTDLLRAVRNASTLKSEKNARAESV